MPDDAETKDLCAYSTHGRQDLQAAGCHAATHLSVWLQGQTMCLEEPRPEPVAERCAHVLLYLPGRHPNNAGRWKDRLAVMI